MIALDQRGAPKSLTYIVLATIQIAPRFQAKANTILDAQRARGLETEGGVGRRVRDAPAAGRAARAGQHHRYRGTRHVVEARAFSREGKKTSLLVLRDSTAQKATRILLLLAMGAAVAAGVWLRRVS